MEEPKEILNPKVKGYDFNEGINYEKMFANLRHMGI